MVVFPNAKINIGLHIVKKRPDGFHNIESIFYPLFDLFDVLEIVENKEEEETQFTSTGIPIPGDSSQNLCVKAFNLLQKDYKIPFVKIHLHKIIPIGAGLGGGSSDAAFSLKLLNDLFELKLNDEELMNYARELGSDCAFFIKNKPVYAFEKGDVFNDLLLNLSNYKIKVEYPNIHIGTAEAYAGITAKPTNNDLIALANAPIQEWKGVIKNDFEEAIYPNYPKIKALKEKMYDDAAIYASMTGSGSAVYGIYEKS